ncbi:Cof-type HAD-IIB family hydrolase [Filobacillus milosensis]|uniref:Cof-type HAD-IIB family hydrolase n=1 Tax=Filobacillus milosensis TaxID=94137 RepID=A0A4Y8IKX7_9BACI|nr:Cof-type HAD-IIB family hydrolase [Filobacillus milosensis]TFB14239.1 Cof-type HAD-IIB family hydrolase [Filobacillus milosensis]
MNKHIVFFDIDGTLLDHDKQLPASTKEAIFTLKENGHEVAIATGRAPFMFAELREELGIDTYVSYNGQFVVLSGEVIYRNPLNKDALEDLTEMAVRNDHPVVYMDDEDMKANVPEHDYINESIATLKIDQFPTHDPHYIKRELYQSLLFCEKGEETIYEQSFNQFDFIRWHPFSVDIIPAGGSKAKGIQKLVEHLDISNDRLVAFGDGLNDIEMLKQIEHSFAMGNGHSLAKKAAKYETKSVDADGIVHGLRKINLI